MRPLTCPECRASLDVEAIDSTGVWECPYCGQPLPEVRVEPTEFNLLFEPNDPAVDAASPMDSKGASSSSGDELELAPLGKLPEAIHIVEDDADRLSFWLPPVTMPVSRWVIVLVCWLLSAVWFSALGSLAIAVFGNPAPGFRVATMVGFLPFGFLGLMPLALSRFVWHGRISVTLDREQLSVRWHLGPLGLTNTMPFVDISNVRMEIPRCDNARPPNAVGPKCCVVTSKKDNTYLLLTFLDYDPVVSHVTALVKRKWQSLRPANESQPMTKD